MFSYLHPNNLRLTLHWFDPEYLSKPATTAVGRTVTTRDTYKYQFKVGQKIVHRGITNDLERRQQEHQQKWPQGHLTQVGRRTTEEAARTWEDQGGKR